MAKNWLQSRAGDTKDIDFLHYNGGAANHGGGIIYAVNKQLVGGMGGAFAVKKLITAKATVPGASTYTVKGDDFIDNCGVLLKVESYDPITGDPMGAPVLPLIINNIVVAVDTSMSIVGTTNTPVVGVRVKQHSTTHSTMGLHWYRVIIDPDGAIFPAAGWETGGASAVYYAAGGAGAGSGYPGALGFVPKDHADWTSETNGGIWTRDAVARGGLFWGNADLYDELHLELDVTGSNETDAVFMAQLSFYMTGWILPRFYGL
jgi:hypothetical protein